MSEKINQVLDVLTTAVTGPLLWLLVPLTMAPVFSYLFAKNLSVKLGLTSFTLSIIFLQIPSAGFYNNVAAFTVFCIAGFALLVKWRFEQSPKPSSTFR